MEFKDGTKARKDPGGVIMRAVENKGVQQEAAGCRVRRWLRLRLRPVSTTNLNLENIPARMKYRI
jgi:hypothetical protein